MNNKFQKVRFPKLLRAFFFAFATLISYHLFSQADDKTHKAIESISHYVVDGNQWIDELLQKPPIAYKPPRGSVLENEWTKLTPYAKISLVYDAAVRKQGPQGGDFFLNSLQTEISKRFEAAGRTPIAPNHSFNATPLAFHTYPLNHNCSEIIATIPQNVRKAIFTLAEYSEAGALGGTQNVMRTYLDVGESLSIEILSKHTTHVDALRESFKIAGIPPPPAERIKNITTELVKEFESVRKDKTLMIFIPEKEQVISEVTEKPVAVNADGSPPTPIKKIKTGEFENSNQEFKGRSQQLDSKPESFSKMITNPEGLGGVILGNSFSTDVIAKIKRVNWIPYPIKKGNRFSYGRLEFVFEDTTILRLNNVLQEDIYAAHQLILSNNSIYENGRGIGLVGLVGSRLSNRETRYEILLDSTLRYLNLGWATIVTDIYMGRTPQIKASLEKSHLWNKYKEAFNNWNANRPSGWKICDKPLCITKQKWEINVVDSASRSENLFMMRGSTDNYQSNLVAFENILPAVTEITPEFRRLKDFAKIITLFRWVKAEKVPILGLKNFTFNQYVEPPHVLVVTPNNYLEFRQLQIERDNLRRKINTYKDSLSASKYKKLLGQIDASAYKRLVVWKKIEQKKATVETVEQLKPTIEYAILEQHIEAYNRYDSLNALGNDEFLVFLSEDDKISEQKIKKLVRWKDKRRNCFAKFKKNYIKKYVLNTYPIKLDFSVQQKLINLHHLLNYEKEVMEHYIGIF